MYRIALSVALLGVLAASAQGGWDEGWDAYNRRDYATAAREFMALAEQGDARAQVTLQIMQVFDEDGPRSFNMLAKWRNEPNKQKRDEAVKWFREAADQGDTKAWTLLGHIYDDRIVRFYYGEPSPVDIIVRGNQVTVKPKKVPSKLAKWYRKVAKKGEVTAQKSLAFLLGLQNNMKKSTFWMRKAAEQGDRWAQANLILRETDKVQACIWLTLAMEQGARGTGTYRGQVGCGMEAKKLAQEWKEKHESRKAYIAAVYPHETEDDGTPSCLAGATFGPIAEDSPLFFAGTVGIQVVAVESGSIAENLRLRRGDAVVIVNGHEEAHDLDGFAAATRKRGGVLVLKMLRIERPSLWTRFYVVC